MNPDQLWETTMDQMWDIPFQRLIREYCNMLIKYFSLLIGDKVEPRREFIEEHANYVNLDI